MIASFGSAEKNHSSPLLSYTIFGMVKLNRWRKIRIASFPPDDPHDPLRKVDFDRAF